MSGFSNCRWLVTFRPLTRVVAHERLARRNHGTGEQAWQAIVASVALLDWCPRPGRDNYLRDASYIDAYCQVHAKYLEQNKAGIGSGGGAQDGAADFLSRSMAVAKKRRAVRRETYVRTLNQIGRWFQFLTAVPRHLLG